MLLSVLTLGFYQPKDESPPYEGPHFCVGLCGGGCGGGPGCGLGG